ncbi:ParB-like chromosome segregation protein Spo0J [Bradyrhizobium sp. ERR14]|nr:ParB-like chromosome segregation protein Spo0J [Bradyrhizobium sp. ERR14]
MTKAVQKITLSPSRDIPFNKLVLSQSNVRRVKAGVSIEQLAESIAQRTLLQSLSVRAVVDADGNETGMFEVPAGGRRYRALELLVKQKRMSKTQAVPCVVREGVSPRTIRWRRTMSESACIRLISFGPSRHSAISA